MNQIIFAFAMALGLQAHASTDIASLSEPELKTYLQNQPRCDLTHKVHANGIFSNAAWVQSLDPAFYFLELQDQQGTHLVRMAKTADYTSNAFNFTSENGAPSNLNVRVQGQVQDAEVKISVEQSSWGFPVELSAACP